MSLLDDLIRDEGLKLKVYKCPAGKDTIGCGRNLNDNPLNPVEAGLLGCTTADLLAGKEITREQAMVLLDSDIAKVKAQLDKEFPWWITRPQGVQDAMANMCFQLGLGGLMQFKKMLSCLHAGDYAGAKKHGLDSEWAKQTPERAKRVMDQICQS